MPLSVNTIVHLPLKVELEDERINTVLLWLFDHRDALLGALAQEIVRQIQEQYLDACAAEQREGVCTACGVVQRSGGWVRRGTRPRQLVTSSGTLRLELIQATCRDCAKTRVAGEEVLGLNARQRVSTELKQRLVERVMETSYARSAEVGRSCLGVALAPSTLHRFVQQSAAKLELTPSAEAAALLADGTKVRAGQRKEFEDLRLALQVVGRRQSGARARAHLRLVGLEVGPGSWPRVLGAAPETPVVVTDAELPLRAHVQASYPEARHQFCEWHVGHSLNWSLRVDGVALEERRALRRELDAVLWDTAPVAERRAAYDRFTQALNEQPTSRTQLTQARNHVLFDPPSAERTTSLAERQMREVDRRACVGVRWSESGLANLLRLSFAKKHNPDDYARVWN